VLLETGGGLNALPLLHFHHDAQRFPRLMWAKFIEEVMHVDEQQTDIVNLRYQMSVIQ